MKTLLVLPFAAALFAFSPSPSTGGASSVLAGEHDWAVDGVHSSVVFKIKHCNASWFKGAFDTIDGAVTLDPAKPEAGSVKLTIPVDSIDTNNKQRDDHLKNADFFNSKENPAITFQSTKITKKGNAYEVTGDLALAGKSKSITIPVEYIGEGEMHGRRAGYSTTFTIERSDFGMTYGIDGDALGDAVTLMIDLELIQPKK
jgi:polyisoprenoid-binding protein YceI